MTGGANMRHPRWGEAAIADVGWRLAAAALGALALLAGQHSRCHVRGVSGRSVSGRSVSRRSVSGRGHGGWWRSRFRGLPISRRKSPSRNHNHQLRRYRAGLAGPGPPRHPPVRERWSRLQLPELYGFTLPASATTTPSDLVTGDAVRWSRGSGGGKREAVTARVAEDDSIVLELVGDGEGPARRGQRGIAEVDGCDSGMVSFRREMGKPRNRLRHQPPCPRPLTLRRLTLRPLTLRPLTPRMLTPRMLTLRVRPGRRAQRPRAASRHQLWPPRPTEDAACSPRPSSRHQAELSAPRNRSKDNGCAASPAPRSTAGRQLRADGGCEPFAAHRRARLPLGINAKRG